VEGHFKLAVWTPEDVPIWFPVIELQLGRRRALCAEPEDLVAPGKGYGDMAVIAMP
jgi:hypothetical protein